MEDKTPNQEQKDNKLQENFRIVLNTAKILIKNKRKDVDVTDVIQDYTKVLLYPVMYTHLRNCVSGIDRSYNIRLSDFLPKDLGYSRFARANKEKLELRLEKDIIFSSPESNDSISLLIGYIGHNVNFQEDPIEHFSSLLLPMRIACVTSSGRHSIAQGIITHNGILHPNEIVDVSPALEEYSFDGVNWKNESTKEIFQAKIPEFGWLWEIYKFVYNGTASL